MTDLGHPAKADGLSQVEPASSLAGCATSIPDAGKCFAQAWWDWQTFQSNWEDGFCDLLADSEDYDRLGTDYYDMSLEIYGAVNDWRLNEAQQRYLFDAGFSCIYVNHKDEWQTHYSGGGELPVRGWRRRYVSDPTADTTRVLAGPEDNGYYEISHRPEGWASPMIDEDFASGYYRIVPDPLDAKAIEARQGQEREAGLVHESADPQGFAQGATP